MTNDDMYLEIFDKLNTGFNGHRVLSATTDSKYVTPPKQIASLAEVMKLIEDVTPHTIGREELRAALKYRDAVEESDRKLALKLERIADPLAPAPVQVKYIAQHAAAATKKLLGKGKKFIARKKKVEAAESLADTYFSAVPRFRSA